MSKNVAVFVDVANLYYSARGQDVDVDYVALLKTATKGRDLIRAYAYSGLDPENENQRKFIDFLNKNGYKVLTKDIRKFGDGRVKANLDIELVVDLFRLADRMDIAVIVSGDGDFAPAIKALQDKGVRCEVISFRPNTSSDLMAVADEFIDVMKIAGIGRASKEARAQRGMSAPEMPAKEVVPEFGFREASPSVAQAALAALRENGGRGAGNGARGGRRRAAAAPEAAPTVEATDGAALAEAEGERRRRRRRGGRGRGRRREAAVPADEAAVPSGEIGWTELDDLSQLDELEGVGEPDAEREYTFEEADEATLAELGLLDDHAGEAPVTPEVEVAEQAEEAPPAEEKPKPRRRRTRASAAEAEVQEPAAPDAEVAPEAATTRRRGTRARQTEAEPSSRVAEEVAEEKPARTRRATGRTSGTRRIRKDEAQPAPNAAEAQPAPAEEGKPVRRRARSTTSGRRKVADSGAAGAQEEAGEADGEGIWQRFRSARGRSRPT